MRYPSRLLVSVALSLLVVSALGLALLGSFRSAAHASSSTKITLSPNFGPPTSSMTVSGTGFGASETVNIDFNTRQVNTTTTDSTGAFTATLRVPTSAQPGQHNVTATGVTSM